MAEVTSLTTLRIGTRSLSARATLSGAANDTISNAKLIAVAPTSGALFTFLSGTYSNAAAVDTAFNAATTAGVVILSPVSGAGVAGLAWLWVAAASTPSVQLVNAAAPGVFDVTLLLEHSIIT